MGLFKKKYDYPPFDDEEKKKKRKGCKQNFIAISIIFFVLFISSLNYFATYGIGILSSTNNFSINDFTENDLNLVWSTHNVNQDNLKLKLKYSGLDNLAEDINPISIGTNNTPTRDMQLNFDELGYLTNIVFSFNSEFILHEVKWTSGAENEIKINFTYSYSITNQNKSKVKFLLEHYVNCSLVDFAKNDLKLIILNTSPKQLIENKENYAEISQELIDFMFKTTLNSQTNKTLCEKLGFKSVEVLPYGVIYRV